MYVKLFSSILTSSVWAEDAHTRIVWITMLTMADKDGDVRASASGLARMANVTPEATANALTILLAPDPESATPDSDGRRIVTREGGWHILNYSKYRAIQDHEARKATWRESSQRQRDSQHSSTQMLTSTFPLAKSTEAEAEAEAYSNTTHAEQFGDPNQLIAYQGLRKAASFGASFDAGLAAVASPVSGSKAYTWAVIGRALQDFYTMHGPAKMSPAALRAFCKRIIDDDAKPDRPLAKGASKQERGRAALADTLTRRGFTNGLDHSNSQVPSTIPRALPNPGHHGADR